MLYVQVFTILCDTSGDRDYIHPGTHCKTSECNVGSSLQQINTGVYHVSQMILLSMLPGKVGPVRVSVYACFEDSF